MNIPTSTVINDLTKEAPRSPRVTLGGFVILARAIDKCRATLAGHAGEYHYNCELDKSLFKFKGVMGNRLKTFIQEGHSDEEIAVWFKSQGKSRTDKEILEWSKGRMTYDYSDIPDNKEWLEEENTRLGLDKDATLFDMLDADDKVSFKK